MSKPGTDKLSTEKIQQLLAAVGGKSQDDTSQDVETIAFDWRSPRYFNLDQLVRVNDFSERVVAECIDDFSRLYHDDCRVSLISVRQHFSSAFEEDPDARDYYLPFGTDAQKPFGLMVIPHTSALRWTGLVLGGGDSDGDSDRNLSKLEESFLVDIASSLIGAFSRAYNAALQPGRNIVRNRLGVSLQGADELLDITFEAGRADSEGGFARASFLVCCDKLESIVGKTASGQEKLSDAQIRNAILGHVHQVPVSVRAEQNRLGHGGCSARRPGSV